jgi:hypothetical protein
MLYRSNSAEVPNGFSAREEVILEAECRKDTNSSAGSAVKTEWVAGFGPGCVERQEAEAARRVREVGRRRAVEIKKSERNS